MADETPPPTRRERLWRSAQSQGIPLRAILATVGVVVAAYLAGKLLYRLRDVLLLLAVSGFIALLLNPLVVFLQKWKVPRRGFAVAIVIFWAVLVFAGLAVAFGYPLVNGVTHLADRLPSYVDQAQHGKGWIGQLIRRYHVQTWVQQNAAKIASFAQGLGKPALALGKGAVSLLVALGTIFFLVVLLLIEGPKMREWILGNMTAARKATVIRVSAQVNKAVTGYMAGNLLTSLIAGVVVFVTLFVLGVPFPFLWALWVALVDFLPMIGGALAGIPTVLFAVGHSLTAGIVTLAVFLAYTQIENHVLNPVIMSRTVRINPLLVLISILVAASVGSWIGGFFGGFVAALLAIPAAGAGQVIVSELWRDTAPAGMLAGAGVAGPEPSGAAVAGDGKPGGEPGTGSAAASGWVPAWIVSRPLLITPARWARRAIAVSCVTRTRVRPRSRHSFSSRLMISSLVSSSRLPVGSSASSTVGSLTRARATATRCCCPPDSSPGRCLARSARATDSSAASTRRRRSAAGTPSGIRAASTFSAADSVGTRLKVWKMNPIDRARSRLACVPGSRVSSFPSSSMVPEVGRSSMPSRLSRVDLPCPVRPWIASHSPSRITRLRSRTAGTVRRPLT